MQAAALDEARASAARRTVQHTYARAGGVKPNKYKTAPATRPIDSSLPFDAGSPAPLIILNMCCQCLAVGLQLPVPPFI